MVVDAELNPGHPAEPGGDVRPDAGQRLRHHGRHPAVEHLERLPSIPTNHQREGEGAGKRGEDRNQYLAAGIGDGESAVDLGGGYEIELETDVVEGGVELCGLRLGRRQRVSGHLVVGGTAVGEIDRWEDVRRGTGRGEVGLNNWG